MAVGLTVPSKPKSPFGALVGKTTYGGAAVPSATAAPTPGGTSSQATTDWFTRQTTAPPQPAATTNAQASYDYAADPAHAKEATSTPYGGGMVAGAPILGPRPVDEASIARERELAAQKEATDLAYVRSQAEKASDVEAARALALQQQQMGILPGGATGAHAATAGTAAGGGLTLEQIQEMMRSLGISTTPAATTPVTTPPVVPIPTAPARVEMPAAPDTRAADAATWARSKDIIGRSTSGALKSLREAQAARGFGSESGVYGAQEGEVMSEGLRSLGDVSRAQAENTLAAERAREEMGYQGDITQRAQDLGLSGAGFSGGITQRGQDIDALATARGQDIQSTGQRLGLLPSLLSLLKYAAY